MSSEKLTCFQFGESKFSSKFKRVLKYATWLSCLWFNSMDETQREATATYTNPRRIRAAILTNTATTVTTSMTMMKRKMIMMMKCLSIHSQKTQTAQVWEEDDTLKTR